MSAAASSPARSRGAGLSVFLDQDGGGGRSERGGGAGSESHQHQRLPIIKSSVAATPNTGRPPASNARQARFSAAVKTASLAEFEVPEGATFQKLISVRGDDITPAFLRDPPRRMGGTRGFQRLSMDDPGRRSEGRTSPKSRRVSTARGVTFGQATERSFAIQPRATGPQSARSGGGRSPLHAAGGRASGGGARPQPVLKKVKGASGETPPATPMTWGLKSRGNPYAVGMFEEEEEEEYHRPEDEWFYRPTEPHRPPPGGGLSTHRVSGEEVAEVRNVIGRARREMHEKRQLDREATRKKQAAMVAFKHRQAEDGKRVIEEAREGQRQATVAEERGRSLKNQITKMANEEYVKMGKEEASLERDARAEEWRGVREKGKTVIQQTKEAQADYFRMLQAERGIQPLKRKNPRPPEGPRGADPRQQQGGGGILKGAGVKGRS